MKFKSYFTVITITTILICCKSGIEEKDEYEIISKVLNHSLAHESDEENGLGWIDETKEYSSLLVLNHTNLIESDFEALNSYISLNGITDFSADDFKVKRKWDIEKIKDFNRYKLEVMLDQNVKSPYIGMIQVSSISYNQDFNRALVYTSFLCAGNGDCGEGLVFHLKKNGKWQIEKVEVLWIA